MELKAGLIAVALAIVSSQSLAWAETPHEVGLRLVAASGAPARFQSADDAERTVRIIDTASELRCSIPMNAPQMTLRVNGVVAQCGYAGAIQEMWVIIPESAPAAQEPVDRFAAGYALMQIDSTPSLQVVPASSAPPPLPGTGAIFPNAPRPFRIWLRDNRPNIDLMISIAAVDLNGHRLLHLVSGAADPVTALSELSFLTSTTAPPENDRQ